MSYWSIGLYGGDYPCEVRDEYKDFLLDGKTPLEALEATIEMFQPEQDKEEGHVFWLVIADVQWRLGHLSEAAKSKALQVIHSGQDDFLWDGVSPARLKKRRQVLQELEKRLESPQPKPRKLRQPKGIKCPWAIGDLLSMRLMRLRNPDEPEPKRFEGKYVLLHVVDYQYNPTSCGRHAALDQFPVIMVYDWMGETPPTPENADPNHILDTTLARQDTFGLKVGVVNELSSFYSSLEVKKVGNLMEFPNEITCEKPFPRLGVSLWPSFAKIVEKALEETHKEDK